MSDKGLDYYLSDSLFLSSLRDFQLFFKTGTISQYIRELKV